jgi:hypothetical protein
MNGRMCSTDSPWIGPMMSRAIGRTTTAAGRPWGSGIGGAKDASPRRGVGAGYSFLSARVSIAAVMRANVRCVEHQIHRGPRDVETT